MDAERPVIERDEDIDDRRERVFRARLSHMMGEPRTISRALRIMFIAKYFERMADQAKNVCEQIVLMIEARMIKLAPHRPS